VERNITPPVESMLGSTQVAAILGCGRTKAWELMVSQAITSMCLGNRPRCTRADLETYRRRQYQQAMVFAGVPFRDR
jgi:hypothetical protein